MSEVSSPEISTELLRRWYEKMLLIRGFEDRVHEAFQKGLVFGSTHLFQGQEAVSVGAIETLRDDDTLTYTYRGHGQVLARGLDPEAAFAEIFGRATGCSRGLGGSMHLADPSRGLLGSFAIVGAGIPVAVATSDGLITPVIRDADLKTLTTISREMKDLTLRARHRKLRPDEFQGGGFTVSNLGMYGIEQFEAIINPPQAAVLAVGKAEPRAVMRGGAVATATLATCSLSCDHRVIDGVEGANFLRLFKKILEDPTSMSP